MHVRHFGAALIGACAFMSSAPAFATATLTCDIKHHVLEFSMQVAVGSIAAALSGLHAEIDIKAGAGLPASKFELPPDSIRQQWIDEPDLRLWLHNDGDDKTPDLDLAIFARQKSESKFAGTYRLVVRRDGKDFKRTGRANCEMGS